MFDSIEDLLLKVTRLKKKVERLEKQKNSPLTVEELDIIIHGFNTFVTDYYKADSVVYNEKVSILNKLTKYRNKISKNKS